MPAAQAERSPGCRPSCLPRTASPGVGARPHLGFPHLPPPPPPATTNHPHPRAPRSGSDAERLRSRRAMIWINTDRLTPVAREIGLQIVTARLKRPERLAKSFGQVLQEVGQRMRLVESLDYRADRLGSIFSDFRRNSDESLLYARTADHPADQEAIANRAYADRNRNGDGTSALFAHRTLRRL